MHQREEPLWATTLLHINIKSSWWSSKIRKGEVELLAFHRMEKMYLFPKNEHLKLSIQQNKLTLHTAVHTLTEDVPPEMGVCAKGRKKITQLFSLIAEIWLKPIQETIGFLNLSVDLESEACLKLDTAILISFDDMISPSRVHCLKTTRGELCLNYSIIHQMAKKITYDRKQWATTYYFNHKVFCSFY